MKALAYIGCFLQQKNPRNLTAEMTLKGINDLIARKREVPAEPVPAPTVDAEPTSI
jgi:hypothetical protein